MAKKDGTGISQLNSILLEVNIVLSIALRQLPQYERIGEFTTNCRCKSFA